MEQRAGYELLTPTEAIERKQNEVRASLEKKEIALTVDGSLLTHERKKIVALSFKDLRQSLVNGTLLAVDVLKAFQAKALVESKMTNCITEFIPQAEKWAEDRDRVSQKERAILHGIPISVKENFDVVGMDTTMGLTKRLGKPATRHAPIVEVLLSQGAVPFVKTNLPQLVYSAGCSNPIFGATKNPNDLQRSPGGSSGGEAALIKGGGSILGIGTDMGGSLRIPAACCGISSIKCSHRRISREGIVGTHKDMIGIYGASGFMAMDVDILAVGLESLLTTDLMFKLDSKLPPVHWRPSLYHSTRKLKIGWFESSDVCPASPGVSRAVREAKVALEKMGHSTVPFGIPDLEKLNNLTIDLLMSAGGSAFLKHWEGGEIIDESVKVNKTYMAAPWYLKKLLHAYVGWWSPKLARFASQNAAYSSVLWSKLAERKDLVENIFQIWKDAGIDVLLSPGFPMIAPHPRHSGTFVCTLCYLSFYNFIDAPSGNVPVTFETAEDQQLMEDYPTDDYAFRVMKETNRGGIGMPLSVQIGGLPYDEETVLYAMKQLELALQS